MQRIILYPGSFDPLTYGHLNMIERGSQQCDKLVIAVTQNARKKGLFTIQERLDMLTEGVAHLQKVEVASFTGLLVDFAKECNASAILRGLRAVSDFEFEFQMAHINRRLGDGLETIFMMTGEEHFFVSSSIVREIAALHGPVKDFVPPHVEKKLQERFAS